MKQTRLVKMLAAGVACATAVATALAQADHNNYHDSGPGNRYNNNSGDDNQQCRYDRDIHSGFGLLYVPNSAECGAGALLLHERHGHCGSGRPHRKLVSHSARYAGNDLLHEQLVTG